jgi:serine/threonine protein phosphatase 1
MIVVRTFMLKRRIAIGDIHGCYDLLQQLIERVIRFDAAADELVFLGDYVDRGLQSKEVVDHVKELKENYPDRIILLKGNHEALAYDALRAASPTAAMMSWRINGGNSTLARYRDVEHARSHLIPFIESLELYYETDSHIFVHAGIPYGKDLHSAAPEDLLWDRSFSYEGEKTLIVGHTPKSEVARFNHDKIICVDTGAFMTGMLSAYEVLNGVVYTAKREM